MSDQSTTKLSQAMIESVTRGEASALDNLVAECAPRLHAYVRLHMGAGLRAREASMDIVQSVCREVLEDVRDGFEYRGRGQFLRWLFSVALSKLRERHRHNHRQRRSPERELGGSVEQLANRSTASFLSPSRQAIANEDLDRLEAAFGRLSPDEREAITLGRILGLTGAELAAELGCSIPAARMRLGRALARLSQLCGAPAEPNS